MLDQTDLDAITLIVQTELDNRFSMFLGDYSMNGYPIVPLDGFTKMDGFIGDYNMNGYPIIPLDGFTKVDAFLADYGLNGYPIAGGSVDLTPITSDLALIKGYTDTVETSLTAIKAKTDTITSFVATDLTPVQAVVDAIKLKTDTLTPFVATDLTAVQTVVDAIKTKTDLNLDAKISSVYPQVSALLSDPTAMQGMDYFNLDGNLASFPNGSVVYMFPQGKQYTVEKSYLFQNDTHNFIIMYVLVDGLGKKMVLPQTFLSSVPIGG